MTYWDEQEKYNRWWLNKKCRFYGEDGPYRKVTKIKLYGPPSGFQLVVEIFFDDEETGRIINNGNSFKPQKWRLEVEPPKHLISNYVN